MDTLDLLAADSQEHSDSNSPTHLHHLRVFPDNLALAPRPLLVKSSVDGLTREVRSDIIAVAFAPASQAYRLANASEQLSLNVTAQDDSAVWLLDQLKGRLDR